MTKKIFIGGLPLEMTQEDLKHVLEEYGPLISVKLISDKETGKSRGFGFVELEDEKAELAISELNGASIENNKIKVSIAHPPTTDNRSSGGFNNRPPRSGGGFGGGGDKRRSGGGFGGGNSYRSGGGGDRSRRSGSSGAR